jgi:hypothetical protein
MSFELKRQSLGWATGLIFFSIISGGLALIRLLAQEACYKKFNAVVLGLLGLQLLFIFKLTKLPTQGSFYFVWPSVLLLVWVFSRPHYILKLFGSSNLLLLNVKRLINNNTLPVISVAILLIFLNTTVFIQLVKWTSISKNFMTALHPPNDRELVYADRFDLKALSESNPDCILQFSNEGVYSFFSKRRFCTSFGYSVYISQEAEDAVLSELAAAPPKVIAFKSNDWYWSIYGRSMKDRLPRIHEFIYDNYTFHQNEAGSVLATLRSSVK